MIASFSKPWQIGSYEFDQVLERELGVCLLEEGSCLG